MSEEAQRALDLYVYRVTGMTPEERALNHIATKLELVGDILREAFEKTFLLFGEDSGERKES